MGLEAQHLIHDDDARRRFAGVDEGRRVRAAEAAAAPARRRWQDVGDAGERTAVFIIAKGY